MPRRLGSRCRTDGHRRKMPDDPSHPVAAVPSQTTHRGPRSPSRFPQREHRCCEVGRFIQTSRLGFDLHALSLLAIVASSEPKHHAPAIGIPAAPARAPNLPGFSPDVSGAVIKLRHFLKSLTSLGFTRLSCAVSIGRKVLCPRLLHWRLKENDMANRNRMPVLNARSGHPNGVGRPGPYGPVRPQMGGPPPVMSGPPMPGMLEQKMQNQHDEIQSLLTANQRLAATHVALRQELAAAQQEMQRLNSVIGGISSEKDAQIRSLLEKVAKLENDLRSTEPIKQELLQARGDCQKLHLHSQDLNQQIRNTSQELQRARGELQQVPALRTEIDNLRAELQRARNAFEYEKKANAEQLEQRQAMEKNLVDMARDLEKLRAEATNSEKRARLHPGAAYNGGYPGPEASYGVMQPQVYGDGYSMHPQEAGPASNGHIATNSSENDYGKSLADASKGNLGQNANIGYHGQVQDPNHKATADGKATEEWATHEAPNGKPFYHNLITGLTQWEKPAALEAHNYAQAHIQPGPSQAVASQPVNPVFNGQVQQSPLMSHVPQHQPGGVIQISQQPNMVHPGQNIIHTPQMTLGQHPGGYMSHMGPSLQQPGMYGQPPGPYMTHTGTYMYGGSHMQQPGSYVQSSGLAPLPAGQPPQSLASSAGPVQTPQNPYAPPLLPVQGQPAGATAPAPMPHLVHGHLSYPAPGAVPHPGPPQAPGTQLPPLMPVPLGQPPLLQSPQNQSNQPGSRPGTYPTSNIQQQQQQNQQNSQPSPRQAQNQSRASSQPSPSPSTPSPAQAQATVTQAGHTPHVSAPPVIHPRPPVSETTTPVKSAPAPPPPTATSGPQGANLFVFGIPEDMGDKKLADLFTPYGSVIYSKIGVEKDTGRNRTYGFVSMDSPQSAEAAIQQVNGILISGKRIKVELKRGDNEGQTHQHLQNQQHSHSQHPHQHQLPSGPGPTRWNQNHNGNSGYRPY